MICSGYSSIWPPYVGVSAVAGIGGLSNGAKRNAKADQLRPVPRHNVNKENESNEDTEPRHCRNILLVAVGPFSELGRQSHTSVSSSFKSPMQSYPSLKLRLTKYISIGPFPLASIIPRLSKTKSALTLSEVESSRFNNS